MIEVVLVAYLRNCTGLAALVSNRIYPMRLKQDTVLPAITYQRISTPRETSHDQTAKGLSSPRFQIGIYANRQMEVLEIADALRDCLQGYRGEWSGIRIDAVLIVGEMDMEGAEEIGIYNRMVDYRISHEE